MLGNIWLFSIVLWWVNSMAFAGDWSCAEKNCTDSVAYVCPQCKLPDFQGFCQKHFSLNHKAKNTRSHQSLSLSDHRMLRFMSAPADGESLKRDSDKNNFFGFHPLTAEVLQGPQWDFITQAQSVISLVGSTGSGKSAFIRSLLLTRNPEQAAENLPNVGKSADTLSTTSDINAYNASTSENTVALLDTEGFGGTVSLQALAKYDNLGAASFEKFDHARRSFPRLTYRISDILIFMREGSQAAIEAYIKSIISFAQLAKAGTANARSPHLLLLFNKVGRIPDMSLEQFTDYTDQWQKLYPKYHKKLMKYYQSITVARLTNFSTSPKLFLDQIAWLNKKLETILQQSKSESSLASSFAQDRFDGFERFAGELMKDPHTRYDLSEKFSEKIAHSFSLYFDFLYEQLSQANTIDDITALWQEHVRQALRIHTSRWYGPAYQLLMPDLIEGLPAPIKQRQHELERRLIKYFSSLITCQAHREFVCSKKGSVAAPCEQIGPCHGEEHNSSMVYFTKSESPEELLFAHDNTHIAHACRWNGAFDPAPTEGTLIEDHLNDILANLSPHFPWWQINMCISCLTPKTYNRPECLHPVCHDCAFTYLNKKCRLCDFHPSYQRQEVDALGTIPQAIVFSNEPSDVTKD